MTKITYVDFQGTARTVEAENGATVMETAVRNAIPGIEAECGGACACATCHVYVDEAWREKTGEPRRWKRTCSISPSTSAPIPACHARSRSSRNWTAWSCETPERQG